MNNLSKILIAGSVGATVGAVLGILFAPDEGNETRRKLMRNRNKLMGSMKDRMTDGLNSMEEIKDVLQKNLTKVNRKLEELKA